MMLLKRVFMLCLLMLTTTAYAANIDVLGDLLKEGTAQPGGKVEGQIAISNTSDVAQQIRIYQTDYSPTPDKKNTYADPGSTPRSNSSWITFSPKEMTIPPKSKAPVYYTVQVPDKTDLTGSYWSMLMVEPVAEEVLKPPAAGETKAQVGMRTKFRYAVEILTHIGDTGTREIKFANRQATVKDGKAVLLLDIQNTGERWLRPTLRAEIYDANGVSVGRFEGPRGQLLPSCLSRREIELGGIKAGKYKALVVVDNGDQYVWGAQYDLELQ